MTDDPVYHSKYDLSGDFRGATLNIESQINHAAALPPYDPPPLPPLDEDGRPPLLPPQRDLPPRSRLGYEPNPLFSGRERDLTGLAQGLLYEPAAAPVVISTGTGGMGKTQLAVEFAYRYGRYFAGGVQWVSMGVAPDDPAAAARAVADEVIACGRAMGCWTEGQERELPPEEKEKRVRDAWAGPTPRLIVFDNCEDQSLLAAWRPQGGGARVLVTSRDETWPAGFAVRPLPTLPRDKSRDLLRRYLAGAPRQDTDAELDAVAAMLDDLPLALTLAGSTLAAYPSLSVGDYRRELDRPGLLRRLLPDADARPHAYTRHELDVARTFAVSFDRLRPGDSETDADALLLLAGATYLVHGEPFPRALLLGMLPADDPRRRDRALNRLRALGLLERAEGDRLRLHRLLALFVLEAVGALDGFAKLEGRLKAAARTVAEWGISNLAREQTEVGDPRPLRQWESHLRHVTDSARSREDKMAATLCSNLGHYLFISGDLAGARWYHERALVISERIWGPEDLATGASLNNLGYLLLKQGDLAEARSYLDRALKISERILGSEHPDTAAAYNNLGDLLQEQGDLVGARSYVERALAIIEGVLGPEHPDTASSLNNLGYLLQAQDDLSGARSYYERALEITERVLGPEHPNTATTLNNLGQLLRAQDDLSGAWSYCKRALEITERILGPEHPATALNLNNLGLLLVEMGDLVGARTYLERAQDVFEHALGADHPSTATNLDNLGTLLQAQGDLAGARLYCERALAIRERVLGAEHPNTADSLMSMGVLCGYEEDFDSAIGYMSRALAIYEKMFGPEHPSSAQTREALEALEIVRALAERTGFKRISKPDL